MDKKHIVTARVLKQIGEDRIRFRLTELKVDRHGEVVIPDGIILDEYKKNPIVLFGHGWESHGFVPIGKIDIDSFEVTSEYVDADVIFDSSGKDDFAAMIASKVRDGFLNTGSISFMPKTIDNETVLEGQTGATFSSWELLEFSIVPVPSNTGAIALREFKQELKDKFPDRNIDKLFGDPDPAAIIERLDRIEKMLTPKEKQADPVAIPIQSFNPEEVQKFVEEHAEEIGRILEGLSEKEEPRAVKETYDISSEELADIVETLKIVKNNLKGD